MFERTDISVKLGRNSTKNALVYVGPYLPRLHNRFRTQEPVISNSCSKARLHSIESRQSADSLEVCTIRTFSLLGPDRGSYLSGVHCVSISKFRPWAEMKGTIHDKMTIPTVESKS